MIYAVQQYKSIFDSPRRLQEFEEQRHTLLGIRAEGSQCIAKFPNGEFSFPAELQGELRALVGQEVGILRLDGYHVRAVDDA